MHVWLPSEILPIVGINAGISLVGLIYVGAPHALVMEEVEVCVLRELAYQVDRQFGLIVSERTKFTVIAEASGRKIGLAEFGFILVRVVKLLNPRVAVDALVALWTLLFLRYEAA